MYALNFYSPIVADQLRRHRKTATIRLGDKSGKYRKGMIVQVPLFLDNLAEGTTVESIHAALVAHYAGQDIVSVVPLTDSAKLPRVDAEELVGKDTMKLFVFGTPGGAHVNLVALLDNLGKGASGAAVQNMDLMLSA